MHTLLSSPVSSPSREVIQHDRKEANSIMYFQLLVSHQPFFKRNGGYLQDKARIKKSEMI